MSDSNTDEEFTPLEDLEVGNDAELMAVPPSAKKKATGKKRKAASFGRGRAITVWVLSLLLLMLIVGYIGTVVKLVGIMGENPREIITRTFSNRSGVDTLLVGELLLIPEQRIENLGTIRQRTTEQNFANTLDFLTAIGEDNPPDIPRSLINSTIDPALIETTSIGDLPVISTDGRSPLITYARPFNKELETAQISILIHGLGISEALATAAIRLKPEISLAFSPYSVRLQDLTIAARKAGHEVLLELPMEPTDYPLRDPGPYALRKGYSAEQNITQLEWILSRAQGYVGLVNYQGDALLKDPSFVETFLPLLSRRGLMFVENGTHGPHVKHVLEEHDSYYTSLDILIDINDDEFSLQDKLNEALNIASSRGRVTIGAKPFPLFLMKLALWINELPSAEYTLTPISSKAQIHEARRLGLTG
ncbi:MAG: divergent polysaccharide deacetylase family protein [Alphaproteobacteria bacterium]|nr:divergent polysaccharide deacetylase family protein [Alphaproteobacteria bacterium]